MSRVNEVLYSKPFENYRGKIRYDKDKWITIECATQEHLITIINRYELKINFENYEQETK